MHDDDRVWWIAALIGGLLGLVVMTLIAAALWRHAQAIVP